MAHSNVEYWNKNSENLMLLGRIQQIERSLRSYLYPDSEKVNGFKFRDGQYKFSQIDEGKWVDFDSENDFWGYPECYAWFKHSFTIPERFAGKPVVYQAVPYPDSNWIVTNPQFIVYVNGQLVQGGDKNHQTVLLCEKAKGGEKFDVCLNAYADAWEYKGKLQMSAKIMVVDRLAAELLYDIKVPIEVAAYYEVDDMPRVEIIKALNTAVNMLEIGNPNDYQAFAESAKLAMDYLDKNIYGKNNDGIVASCIGHTHIDVAWLWRLRQTRDKAGRSFATVLKYMDEYPEYKFMSSQAQLYDYVKQDYPEVFEGIKKRVAEKRWEPEGSMWVEADTNVTSGESLVRQFLVGKRFFKKELGVDNKINWLPDVFGYSASLPQIMKKADIDYFMTTKISWNEFNRFPYDTFMWKGIDGTEILSHFSPSTDRSESESHNTTYNTNLAPAHVIGGWRRYSHKDLNKDYLISFGYGDGGGGPTIEMLEKARRMAKGIPGCPITKQEFSLDFFKRLEKEVEGNRHLPTWCGELYLEFHRGTLTSQARNKRYNRKSEVLYHDVETLGSLAKSLLNESYPSDDIYEGWKIILLNQFHDIIPGSSIKEVYEDSKEQYEEITAKGKELAKAALSKVAANIAIAESSLVVFNTAGARRDDVVVTDLPMEGDFILLDGSGNEVPCQKTYDGKLIFMAKAVPAKGYKVFTVRAGKSSLASTVKTDGRKFGNKFFDVEFNGDYNISSLIHKESGRSVAPEGELLNRLIAYEDRPNNHEAWDVKVYYDEKSWDINDVQTAQIVEQGAVRTALKVVRKFNSSTIEQFFIFYNDIDRIDVDYFLDWKEKNIILKADYPVDVNTTKATFDIQFGNLERSTHSNTTWDHAQFEVCGHKWADLSDNSFGLSILNDCKYGWTVKHGHIRPSLLRCATNPNSVQDRENHHFTYSIYPHSGHVSDSKVVEQGYSLNYPLYCINQQPHGGALCAEYSLASVDSPNVIIETIKKAEDSDALIIRMYETWNRKTDCTLSLGSPVKAASECNLMEEKDEAVDFDSKSVRLKFKPFEIKTIKVKL